MTKRIGFGLAIALLFAAPPALAAVPAGFPNGSLWLSDSTLTDGDTTQISTVVYNGSSDAITGTVAFFVDSTVISRVDFALDSRASKIESVTWKSESGSHTVSAKIEKISSKGGTNIDAETVVTNKISVQVKDPPPPSPAVQAVSTATDIASIIAASGTPIVSNIIHSIYDKTEQVREAGLQYAEASAASASGKSTSASNASTPKGQVLGAETENTNDSNPSGFLASAAHAASPVLVLIFKSRAIFYALLLILILFILYLLKRWATRPRF